jgi:hypothetical protein
MRSGNEHIYQISRIIEGVAACLYGSSPESIDYFDAVELAGRLDFAVDSLRLLSGASK